MFEAVPLRKSGKGRGQWPLPFFYFAMLLHGERALVCLFPIRSQCIALHAIKNHPWTRSPGVVFYGSNAQDFAVPISRSTFCRVWRRNTALKVRETSSATGKATQTSSSRPVRDSSHATGSSTTSCRPTEMIRL